MVYEIITLIAFLLYMFIISMVAYGGWIVYKAFVKKGK